uniref:Uncharacterized protein n=1 Tax=viral metagenome TaxID=1070528 RepID=A0A6C0E621_9ZZZZ
MASSDTVIVAQLYCKKAKVNTHIDNMTNRTIVLTLENQEHWISYYDGHKFIKKFGPLSSVEIEHKYASINTLMIIDHINKKTTTNEIVSYSCDKMSFKITLRNKTDFMCLYLNYDDYKTDPLQLQKHNLKNFVEKLITTMPHND